MLRVNSGEDDKRRSIVTVCKTKLESTPIDNIPRRKTGKSTLQAEEIEIIEPDPFVLPGILRQRITGKQMLAAH